MNSEWFHNLSLQLLLLLAFEYIDAFMVLEQQTVGTQVVDGEGIGIEQQFAVDDFPRGPGVDLCLDVVDDVATFHDLEVLVYTGLLAQE